MNPPTIFHEFDAVIYPIKLWIAKNPTSKELEENFEAPDHTPLNTNMNDYSMAQTYNMVVLNKNTKDYGIIILLHGNVQISTIAHEATHAARVIWQWLKEDITWEEADAHLVGWIADCIHKVKLNKITT